MHEFPHALTIQGGWYLSNHETEIPHSRMMAIDETSPPSEHTTMIITLNLHCICIVDANYLLELDPTHTRTIRYKSSKSLDKVQGSWFEIQENP